LKTVLHIKGAESRVKKQSVPRCQTLDFCEDCNCVTNKLNHFSLRHHILMKLLNNTDKCLY